MPFWPGEGRGGGRALSGCRKNKVGFGECQEVVWSRETIGGG